MQELQIQSLGWEDPLEKEMATCFRIPAGVIPRTEEPGGLQSLGSQRVRRNLATEHTHKGQTELVFIKHLLRSREAFKHHHLTCSLEQT